MAEVSVGITAEWEGRSAESGAQRLEAQMDELIATVQRLGVVTAYSGRKMTTGFQRTAKAAKETKNGFNELQKAAVRLIATVAGLTFVGNIIRNVGDFAIRAIGEFQSIQTRLLLVTDSFEEMDAVVAELGAKFRELGVDANDGLGLFSRLSLLGVKNAKELSVSVATLASTFGLSRDAIQRTTMAISQMFSKGQFVRAEEFSGQLQEALPEAARVAAEGFRQLGNTALDTTQEISRAVIAGTLSVQDFYDAIIVGTKAFDNQAARVLNLGIQFQRLIETLKAGFLAWAQYTGAGQAFSLVLNLINQKLDAYILRIRAQYKSNRQGEDAITSFGVAVFETSVKIIKYIASLERGARTVVHFTSLVVNSAQAMVRSLALTVDSAMVTGALIGLFARGFSPEAMELFAARARNLQNTWNSFAKDTRQVEDAMVGLINAGKTPFADSLRKDLGSTQEVVAKVREAFKKPLVPEQPKNTFSDAQGGLKDFSSKLDDLNRKLAEIGDKAADVSRGPMSEFNRLMMDAVSPIVAVQNDLASLRGEFVGLAASGVDVFDQLAAIEQVQNSLAEATQRATKRAREQFSINQRSRELTLSRSINDADEEIRGLNDRLSTNFITDAQQRIIDLERSFGDQRLKIAGEIASLSIEYDQLMLEGSFELAHFINAEVEVRERLLGAVQKMSPALVLAAENTRKFNSTIISSLTSSLSDLIVGITNLRNFDAQAWARQLVDTITRTIADRFAAVIVEKILGARKQTVQNMVVQNMVVRSTQETPTPGIGGGNILSKIFSIFSGGGGGAELDGNILQGLGETLSANTTMFARGGIVGGPTLFGMAGEKGKEGVLPLETIGGKLGVNANMAGGETNLNVNIQAIDAQSGAEFILKNSAQIVQAMQHQRALGRG